MFICTLAELKKSLKNKKMEKRNGYSRGVQKSYRP